MAKKTDRPAEDHGGSIGRTGTERVQLDPRGRPIVPKTDPKILDEQRTVTALNREPDGGHITTASEPAEADRNVRARASEASDRQALATQLNEIERQVRSGNANLNQSQLDRRNEIANALDATADRQEFLEADETETAAAETDAESDAERARLEAEAAAEAAGATAEPIETEPEPEAEPKKYKLNINGRDVELTESEVLARAQKVSSADEYLQSAAEALKRSTQAPTPSDEDVPANVEQDDVEATLTSALMGDKEAIAKVAQRLKAPSGPSPDVLKAVDDRVSFRSAVDWFKAEYADVTTDPMLYQLVVQEDSKLAKSQPALSYHDRLKSAGDTVRTWRDKIKGPAAPAAPAPNPKLARKAAVAPVPQASGRQPAPSDEEDTETVESVIDKMAKGRHQVGAIRPGGRQ